MLKWHNFATPDRNALVVIFYPQISPNWRDRILVGLKRKLLGLLVDA